MVIGITGSIGSGKSTVSQKLIDRGYQVIDCDKINHLILRENEVGYLAVIQEFGTEILTEDNQIDRKKLGSIVFANKEKKELLNQILHPIIRKKVIEEINQSSNRLIFLDCPLLFETDFYELCDLSIVVYIDLDSQIKRIMARDKIDFPSALRRIYAQMSLEEKMERADFIIDNCHAEADLDWQISQILFRLEKEI